MINNEMTAISDGRDDSIGFELQVGLVKRDQHRIVVRVLLCRINSVGVGAGITDEVVHTGNTDATIGRVVAGRTDADWPCKLI